MVTFHSTYCIDEVENSGLVKGGGGSFTPKRLHMLLQLTNLQTELEN